MKAIRRLILLILVIAACVFVYKHYKPQIAGFLTDKGFYIPGITDETPLFPTTRTVTDQNGTSSFVVNIPSAYTENITSDMIDTIRASSEGRVTVQTNTDGSIELIMTPEYRQELMDDLSKYFDDSVLSGLTGGDVLDISHNEYYSVFTVTCNSNMSEAEYLALSGKLFASGKAYASFMGLSGDSIVVVFVSSETGEVTNSYRSDDLASGIASDAEGYVTDFFENAMSDMMNNIG